MNQQQSEEEQLKHRIKDLETDLVDISSTLTFFNQIIKAQTILILENSELKGKILVGRK